MCGGMRRWGSWGASCIGRLQSGPPVGQTHGCPVLPAGFACLCLALPLVDPLARWWAGRQDEMIYPPTAAQRDQRDWTGLGWRRLQSDNGRHARIGQREDQVQE